MMRVQKIKSELLREKIVWLGRIPLYHRRSSLESCSQKILGIPIRQKVFEPGKIKYYFLGIRLAWINEDGCFRRTPPELPVEKYVKLKHSEPKELLITPVTGLGDYLVTRNLIAEIKKTEKYRNYRITMICDKCYQFARYLDAGVVDKFLPMRISLQADVQENWRIAEKVRRGLIQDGMKPYYDTILFIGHVVNGQKILKMAQHLVYHVVSRERIEFEYERKKNEILFFHPITRVVMAYYNLHSKSVFRIWKEYFETFLGRKIDIEYPVIETEHIPSRKVREGRYMVVNPCCSKSNPWNMWHRNNWVDVLEWAGKSEKLEIVIAVARGEASYAKRLQAELRLEGVKVDVVTGLPLPDLLALLNGAELFAGLDSGIFHLAAAMGKKAICVSSGCCYDRWLRDYDGRRGQLRVVLPPQWKKRFMEELTPEDRGNYTAKAYPINAVIVDDVKKAIFELLHSCKDEYSTDIRRF